MQHWAVRSMLAQLRGDYTRAERVFVKQGQVDEAIEMYQTLHRWDDAIKVAEQASHPDVEQMKSDYFGEYLSEGAAREWSTVVKICIPPPSFNPVSLSLSRSPLFKTPKQVFF